MRNECSNQTFIIDRRGSLSERQILKEVRDSTLFGMVEVDIKVPDQLKEFFAEFQPIVNTQRYLEMASVST